MGQKGREIYANNRQESIINGEVRVSPAAKENKIREFEWDPRYIPFFKTLSNAINKTDPNIIEVGAHWGQDTIRLEIIYLNL